MKRKRIFSNNYISSCVEQKLFLTVSIPSEINEKANKKLELATRFLGKCILFVNLGSENIQKTPEQV